IRHSSFTALLKSASDQHLPRHSRIRRHLHPHPRLHIFQSARTRLRCLRRRAALDEIKLRPPIRLHRHFPAILPLRVDDQIPPLHPNHHPTELLRRRPHHPHWPRHVPHCRDNLHHHLRPQIVDRPPLPIPSIFRVV